ncbi:hypothetical protein [Prescottella equi]|uniref:hypothetical protein n=1 Tax=Rhodococcus hoagii TaxID=43767 RepID=UPI000A0FE233|nr:hypothetical protein [Prescottella equi]ORM02889.1 hypothetical protein A5N72_17030 [Prescottella equi]
MTTHTHASASVHAEPRRRLHEGWADRSKISETSRDHHRHLGLGITLALVLTAADAVLLSAVANILIRSDSWKSWLLVLGLCAAIVALAVFVGNQLRHAVATGKVVRWMFTGFLLAVWVAVGVLLMVVRWNSGALENTTVVYEDGGALPDAGDTSSHMWLAVLLLGLHLALGVIAVLDGYRLTNPVAAELRRVNPQLDTLKERLEAAEANFRRASDTRDLALTEEQRIDDDLKQASKHADAVFEQLRDSVRLHIAALLGDTGATDGARRTTTPVHAVSPPQSR